MPWLCRLEEPEEFVYFRRKKRPDYWVSLEACRRKDGFDAVTARLVVAHMNARGSKSHAYKCAVCRKYHVAGGREKAIRI